MRLAILVTFAATFWWAALSVTSRALLLKLSLDPWMFTFIQLCAGGAILLLIGGRKTASIQSFKSPYTWVLGVLRVISAALYTSILGYVSVLETGTIGTLSVPFIAIFAWISGGDRFSRTEWVGHLMIMAGIMVIIWQLNPEIRQTTTILMLLNAASVVAMNLLAERHPENSSSHMGVRLRFTGSVLLVTAGIFMGLKLLQGELTGQMWDLDIVIAGVAVGVLLRAPSMVFAFWSIKLIGALKYTVAVSALPFVGFAIEQATIKLGLLDQSQVQFDTILLAALVLAGTFVVLGARRRK